MPLCIGTRLTLKRLLMKPQTTPLRTSKPKCECPLLLSSRTFVCFFCHYSCIYWLNKNNDSFDYFIRHACACVCVCFASSEYPLQPVHSLRCMLNLSRISLLHFVNQQPVLCRAYCISKSSASVTPPSILGCAVLSALFVYRRAKLGHGLLSGEYSKPVADPTEENGAPEPRVRTASVAVDLQLLELTDNHSRKEFARRIKRK